MSDDDARPAQGFFSAKSAHEEMFDIVFKARNIAQIARCAALFSLAEHLGGEPCCASRVAEAEGLDPEATYRFLVACVAFGLARREEGNRFSGTPLLATLRRDDPSALGDFAISQNGHAHWASWGRLDQAIRTGRRQDEAALGRSFWDHYASAEGEAESAAFSRALGGGLAASDAEVAEFIRTGRDAFAVDVGGSSGAVLHALARRDPTLKGAVLDLPHVQPVAEAAARAAGLEERIGFAAGDFFKEAPAADLYLLRMILHDWSDDRCLAILRNCRRSARPGARLVVVELLMDAVHPDPFSAGQDMNMLVVNGAKERTIEEFSALMSTAGFRLDHRHPTRTPFAILEASLA